MTRHSFRFGLLPEGNPDIYNRQFGRARIDLNGAPMCGDDPLRDAQTQTAAVAIAGMGGVAAEKAIEYSWKFFSWYPRAGVGDGKRGLLADAP